MLHYGGCPRCKGTVVATATKTEIDKRCIACGWDDLHVVYRPLPTLKFVDGRTLAAINRRKKEKV